MESSLADNPNAELAAGFVAEELKTSDVSLSWARRKLVVGSDHFSEESCGLLPFALFGDIAIVASAESENREQVSLAVEVVSQPRPCRKVGGSQLSDRRGPEFRVLPEEGRDLQSVHITDGAKTSSPGVAVAVFG